MIRPGLYEQIINNLIQRDLAELDPQEFYIERSRLDDAESTILLAKYMEKVLRVALDATRGEHPLNKRVELCNQVIQMLARETTDPYVSQFLIRSDAELLLALLDKQNSPMGVTKKVDITGLRPQTSIAQSSLFTGARSEPSMVAELQREILTSDRIDMLVSFIKWSGLRLLLNELEQFTVRGQLRIITTSYMGATDIKAIDALRGLPNTSIRVSYDTSRTRLHAKAYIFHRDTGFSTAYIGSSNISNAALSSGLEWNVKVAASDQPETFEKVAATFEGYWNDYEFTTYEDTQRPTLVRALRAERYEGSSEGNSFLFDIQPYGFQKEILEKLDAERNVHGSHRNLIVAATGTGKTVISAFDYKRFRETRRGKPGRLLFVAHREEILRQSRDCFRGVLHDENFGELFVGGKEPESLDHLFVSIQTLNSRNLPAATSSDFYDFIVVDEFHHAAAPTYQQLLEYYSPSVLLGLTATPERLDGKDVTEYFDGRMAAEIRLPEAIDRGLLAPFQYFGVSDNVDLSQLHWRRGGYDVAELNNVYTGNRQRADLVVRSVNRYVTDTDRVTGLGFCVSVHHARFMAEFMNQNGIPSIALHAASPQQDRATAKQRLTDGEIRFIFVVDLYNEGVDIPAVNTVLFLRPTESLTVFLQQLGRGLRLDEGKECLTVLDFIGQSYKNYRFEEKFRALLANTSPRPVHQEVTDGFLNMPRGCFIQLEKQAKEYVLDNIRQAVGNRRGLVNRIQTFTEETGRDLTLSNFLEYYHLSLRELYRGQKSVSFARLCAQAGIQESFADPDEAAVTKALSRISTINSRRWIHFLLGYLENPSRAMQNISRVLAEQMLLMFHYTVWQKPLNQCGFKSLEESVAVLRRNPVLCAEVCAILRINLNQIDFVDEPVDLGFENALDLHCTYSRDQVLAALGFYTVDNMPAMREGVKYLGEKKLDIFFITLDKSEKDYSPTTMYKDYAINDVLFHWQSQSTTPADSPTGQRYIRHKKTGNRMALFVRERKADMAGALPYTFLGIADYVSHTGSRPMNVTWRLHRPIPAAFLKKVSRLVVS
ncbi:DUF3427 domain-containing protein [Alicyclobacillus curvatus]|nr:DUF3427 domain-containing protein [Alicyclobacillus curvatus]